MKNLIWLILLAAGILHAQTVAEGKKVFETSCAVGYCHGVDGRAGKGPRLRDRVWSRNYLYKTIEQGIPGSGMPAWQGRLSEDKIATVIAYIFTISREDSETPIQTTPAPAAAPELAGRSLFFDPQRDRNCGVCHRISDSGAEIAPPFQGLRTLSAQALLKQIQSQPASDNNIQVHLQDGEQFCGVRAGEDYNSLRIYDLEGTGPPVLRTIQTNSVLNSQPCPALNVHADNSTTYTAGELLSIVAFLRARDNIK
jgi:mono/diheme cytochrome c family protein